MAALAVIGLCASRDAVITRFGHGDAVRLSCNSCYHQGRETVDKEQHWQRIRRLVETGMRSVFVSTASLEESDFGFIFNLPWCRNVIYLSCRSQSAQELTEVACRANLVVYFVVFTWMCMHE